MLGPNFWRKYFKEYDVLNNLIPYQELLERIIQKVDVQKEDYILDAGSGTGNLAMKLEERGAEVVAVDFSEEGQERHKQKSPKQTKFMLADLTKPLPFPDNHFDKIVSNNTIYSLPQQAKPIVFNEFFRVLKDGGKVVVSNVHTGFSPLKIYIEHNQKSLKRYGFFRTLASILRLVVPTIKIYYYNVKIKREDKRGDYWFIKEGEQDDFLREAGFSDISDEEFVYADQAILTSAKK